MTDFKTQASALLESLETQSKQTQNFAELELLILKTTQKLGQSLLKPFLTIKRTCGHGRSRQTPQREFPPILLKPKCPTCQTSMSKSETRTATLKTLWGEIQHSRIRYRCHKCQSSLSQWADPSLDNSHCSPLVLSRTQEFALHVPYRTAQAFLHTWGVNISSSQIADLSHELETSNSRLWEQHLENLAGQA